MLRFLGRFYAVCQFKSGWIEPCVVGGYAPFSPWLTSQYRQARVGLANFQTRNCTKSLDEQCTWRKIVNALYKNMRDNPIFKVFYLKNIDDMKILPQLSM